ncbi:MAG TPA: TIGR03435 family protein [Candidatus Sulfopaludibacter sp.]|jgi:uncharacterized protein (TIGR03435 family)|nr:TIGR03435 family protein [Candidatus Sulfopaludibacter sp.]
MRVEVLVLATALLQTPGVNGQAAPAFDAASIKPSRYPGGNLKTIHLDPGMVTIQGMSLRDLVARAYGRGHALQISRTELVDGGAKWCETALYDINAKPGADPQGNGEPVSAMLQALLVERFKLAFHHEARDSSGYRLTQAKGGPKLRPRHAGDGGEARVLGRTKRGDQGEVHIELRDASPAALAAFLGNMLERPVIDKSELSGTFDCDLVFTPDETQFGGRYAAAAQDSTFPDLATALREQLGLRLDPGKVPVDVMMIDHAERPAAN